MSAPGPTPDLEMASGSRQTPKTSQFPEPYSNARYPQGIFLRRHLLSHLLRQRILEIDLVKKERELDNAFRDKLGKGLSEVSEAEMDRYYSSTDKDDKVLRDIIIAWMDICEKHGQCCVLTTQVAQLPNGEPYFLNWFRSKILKKRSDIFAPSPDEATLLGQKGSPVDPDFFVLKDAPGSGLFTTFIITKVISSLYRRFAKDSKDGDVEVGTVSACLTLVTCIFFPLLLMVSLYALQSMASINHRIAGIGGFSIIINMFLAAMDLCNSHQVVVAATVAFFAVANIFVDRTSANCMAN